MRAVLYTGGKKPWAEVLGERPWALLPVASRPLLSYWLELCVDLGITDVQILLGRDAEYIEMFCGNGEKWGLSINYSFTRDQEDPLLYLSRDPERWSDGLFYIGEALFPRRQADFTPEKLKQLNSGCYVENGDRCALFIGRQREAVEHFIRTGRCNAAASCVDPCEGTEPCRVPAACGLDFTVIRDITHYYQLNMEIVRNEMDRYLSSGYSS
ncbi:MAG: hypothetical protein PHP93_07175, partial [Kiritimatiellales bacterium]|nr:hypothetical protein [Kiritimatiellales bacterium]